MKAKNDYQPSLDHRTENKTIDHEDIVHSRNVNKPHIVLSRTQKLCYYTTCSEN